jgi:hypothetical protein
METSARLGVYETLKTAPEHMRRRLHYETFTWRVSVSAVQLRWKRRSFLMSVLFDHLLDAFINSRSEISSDLL